MCGHAYGISSYLLSKPVKLIKCILPGITCSIISLCYFYFKVEFSRGLVVLAMEKLLNDIPNMLYDEHIFSHMIDEVLSFDKELKNTYGYPENHPGCLHVLTQESFFAKWLRVEKKCEFKELLLFRTLFTNN